jgi:hypothetical protein
MPKTKNKEEQVEPTDNQGLQELSEQVDKEEGGTEQKDDGKVVQHPQFQHRIDQLVSRMNEAQTKLDKANVERQEERAAFDQLAQQYKDLSATLDNVQDKVDTTNMPDPIEDPVGYANAREEKLLRKVEKIVSNNTQAKQPSQTSNNFGQNSQQSMNGGLTQEQKIQEIAFATIHSDYYDIVNEIYPDLTSDPVLRNQIFSSINPPLEAYNYGKEKRKRSDDMKNKQYGQAFAEGGSLPPTGEKEQPLSTSDKIIIRKLGMTSEEYINHRNKMKKEGRIR